MVLYSLTYNFCEDGENAEKQGHFWSSWTAQS